MRFNRLDMNLLAVLDILLETRSVTQAAKKMFITQSAMSNALGRLRVFFDDPLLVQVGRKMELSPLSETLRDPVREIMARVEIATQIRPNFDPATDTRSFSIVISDYSLAILGPQLSQRIAANAPNIQLNLRPQIADPSTLLDRGEVDLLIIPDFLGNDQHAHQNLFEDELAVLVSSDGCHANAPMTRDSFMAAQHVLMEPFSGQQSFSTLMMLEAGLAPKKSISTFLFTSIPHLVRGTDRVALIQRHLAELAMVQGGVEIKPSPIKFPKLKQSIRWHAHRSTDPGLVWLRDLIVQCAQGLDDPNWVY